MRRVLSIILFSAFLCLLIGITQPNQGYAQSVVDATLQADPAEVTVGDVFTLTLQVIHPSDSRATPGQLENQWGSFEIRKIEAMDTVPIDGSNGESREHLTTQQFQATLWVTGTHTTPDLQVSVTDQSGSVSQYDVRPATVRVNSVLQLGDQQLRDIKPQASLPFMPTWLKLLIGAIILAGLIGVAYWWLERRRRRQPVDVEEEPVYVDNRPADVKALEALRQIAEQHLPTQRRFAEHYDLVTDVLRRYLQDGFDVSALDLTTTELKYTFPANTIDREQLTELFRLLDEADLVKFAQVEPEFNMAEQLPEQARAFILSTAPLIHKPTPHEPALQNATGHNAAEYNSAEYNSADYNATGSAPSQNKPTGDEENRLTAEEINEIAPKQTNEQVDKGLR